MEPEEKLPKLSAESSAKLIEIDSKIRHDLRTPINQIIGYTEMLLEDAEDEGRDKDADDLGRIHRAAHQLLQQLESLFVGNVSDVETKGDKPLSPKSSKGVVFTAAPLADTESGKVLVVDDEESNRDILVRYLERLGHTALQAEDGRQALEALAAGDYDLVLLDVMMPEMDGTEVLRRIKSKSELHHVPVIMISAMDDMAGIVKCIELGAEDYLPKPFNPVLLRARVHASLARKRFADKEREYLLQIDAERQRSDELLHVILPKEVVVELKEKDTFIPKRFDDVAVMFCDIVGFTSYCEGRAPEEVVKHLSQLVEAFERLSVKHGLEKIKTIGDGYMATAGLLDTTENNVLRCVACGLEMVEVTREFGAGWTIRIGVHVGPVLAGVVGRWKYVFDIWGDTVNTAARVESHGTPETVHVSDVAWQRIQDRCVAQSRGLVDVKGKGPMELYRVDRVTTSLNTE